MRHRFNRLPSMGHQPMRAEHARTLEILLGAERPMTMFELGRADGRWPRASTAAIADLGRYLAQTLVETGAVAREGRAPVRFDITERGRIALAIWKAKENRHDRPLAAAVHC